MHEILTKKLPNPRGSLAAGWPRPADVILACLLGVACVGASATETLTLDGKSVSYWPAAQGSTLAGFEFDMKGYRNTYTLDCEKRLFLWTNNVLISTGQATGNSAGAEWKPLNPDSRIANAVYEKMCPGILGMARKSEKKSLVSLFESCRNDDSGCTLELVSQLLRDGADPNEAGHSSARPLQGSVQNGLSNDVLHALIQAGADVNGTDAGGHTALMAAAEQGWGPQERLDMLIDAGADVNAQDENGLTALMQVARAGISVEHARALLNAGADPNIKVPDTARKTPGILPGDTALDFATRQLETRRAYHASTPARTKELKAAGEQLEQAAAEIVDLIQSKMSASATIAGQSSTMEIAKQDPPAEDLLKSSATDQKESLRGHPEPLESRRDAQTTQGEVLEEPRVAESGQPAAPGAGAGSPRGVAAAGNADRVDLKDGSVLTGAIQASKVPFASSFGPVAVDLGEVQDFTGEALRLADGSVLKGRFGEGMIEIATSRGGLKIPAQDIVAIARGAGKAVAPAPVVSIPAQAGQGVLTGRAVDNFGQPVVGGTVRIAGTNLATETRPDGSYQIPYVPGNLVVQIQRAGYDPAEFNLQLAQASTYPVEDKVLVKVPPGNEVYFLGEKDYVSLGRCSVDQTQKDSRDFESGGTSSYVARGKPAAIVAEGTPAFLDATGKEPGLLLYRVQQGDTIIRIERKGGFGGFMGEVQSSGPAAGALDISLGKIGPHRPVYAGALAPGVYAFVQKPWAPANLVYPADVCFKFEIKAAGQMLRERAEREAAKPQKGDGAGAAPAVPLAPGDEATEAALKLGSDQRQQVQGWLNALGFDAGTPDGQFGSGTRRALSTFQRSAGVADTGYLSDSQVQHLRAQAGRAVARQTVRVMEASLVPIPGGCFQMGSPASEAGRDGDEGPLHKVCVKPFKLSRFEVTIKNFRAFVAATGYRTDAERNAGGKKGCWTVDFSPNYQWDYRAWASWQRPHKSQDNRDDHPVGCVSWNDAKAFIGWLNDVAGGGWRLPSEAEWEYAARAGTTTARFWGNSPDQACRFANVMDQTKDDQGRRWQDGHACSDGYHLVAPVGSYRENPWGLYDMLGNASEWTEDCYNKSYKGAPADGAPWTAGDCGKRIMRGASFHQEPDSTRSAARFSERTVERYDLGGFRVARTD